MLVTDRRQKIIEILRIQGSVKVEELSRHLQVSEETIRRDLNILEEEGQLNRVYGGAYLGHLVNQTLPNDMRKETMQAEKQRVAELCAGMIRNGDTIMLDCSTTAYYLAKRIINYKNLTVITNSLDIAFLLSSTDDIHVVCCGGHLNKKYMSFIELDALESLGKYYADICFVSCTGIDLKNGLNDSIEMQGRIRREMIRRSQKKVCIADMTKIGKTTFFEILPLHEIDALVLDAEPPRQWLEGLAESNVICYYPGCKEQEGRA